MTKEEFVQVINTIASQYERQLFDTNAKLYQWQHRALQERKGFPRPNTPEYQEYLNDMMQYNVNSNMLRLVRDYVSLPALKRIEHMSEAEMAEYRQAKQTGLSPEERKAFQAKTDEEIKSEIIESRGLSAFKTTVDNRYLNDEDQYFVTISEDPMKRAEYINLGLRTWNLMQQVVYGEVRFPFSVNPDFAKEVLGDIGFDGRTKTYASGTTGALYYTSNFGNAEADLRGINYDLEKVQQYRTRLGEISRKLDTSFSFARLQQFLPGEIHGVGSKHGVKVDWDLMREYADSYFYYNEHFSGQDPEEIRMRVRKFSQMSDRLVELTSKSFKTRADREEIEMLTARVGAFQDDFYSTIRICISEQMSEQLSLGRRNIRRGVNINEMTPVDLQMFLDKSKELVEQRATMLNMMETELSRTKGKMTSALNSRNESVVACHQQFRNLVGIEDPNKFVGFAAPEVESLNNRMFAAVKRKERERVIERIDTLAQEQSNDYEQQLQNMTPEQLKSLRERIGAEGLIDSQIIEEPTIGGVKR